MRNKSDVLVSIGIPFYNSEEYLDFAIRSVLNQTYTHWELFLLDDGSDDNSLSIAKKYEYDSRVTVISDGQNKGLPYRLNELTLLASGKYYARMDADDIMFPERIETQLIFLEDNSDVDVVGSSAVSINYRNNICAYRAINKILDRKKESILKGYCFIHPTIMGKMSWFKNNEYREEIKKAQDIDLWLRTISHSNFININKPLLFYREGNIPTVKKYVETLLCMKEIIARNKDIDFLFRVVYLITIHLKAIVYLLLSIFGLTDFLIRKRGKVLKRTDFLENKLLVAVDYKKLSALKEFI